MQDIVEIMPYDSLAESRVGGIGERHCCFQWVKPLLLVMNR
jgi:hypothetical protein